MRLFNPLALDRWGIRNHRKLLVCDERVAFVGGFNIASDYDGDGVTQRLVRFGAEGGRAIGGATGGHIRGNVRAG